MNQVHISNRPPAGPPDADFAIVIDFKKDSGDPARVFRAADKTIRALALADNAFCSSIDSSIRTMLVLEDIEAGSIKIWLKNILTATDDDALKNIDWKPAVGKYLVRAKYVYLKWANKSEPEQTLSSLTRDIQTIASETDVLHLPDYAPPQSQDLIAATRTLDEARGDLIEGDELIYRSADEDDIRFDLGIRWDISDLEAMSVKETAVHENMSMNLIVKKPDYLGNSMWDLRHGNKTISAKMEDGDWLEAFQDRQIDIRPGDALKCKVTLENRYGFDNELISESFTITKVMEVLEKHTPRQHSWISGQSLIGRPKDDND